MHAQMSIQNIELKTMLQALPTKADIEQLIGRLEEAHQKEIREVKKDIQTLTTRLINEEASIATIKEILTVLELTRDTQKEIEEVIQLQLEDLENWNRRNNLQGVAESITGEKLIDSVKEIFKQVLGDKYPEHLEIDRIHRAFGYRNLEMSRPRDVICRIHHYT